MTEGQPKVFVPRRGADQRQGIGQGLALEGANRDIIKMAGNLYNDDMNRMVAAMSQAPALANLGMGIPWFNVNQMKGLLGDPTVLGGASGSQSESESYGSTTGGSSDYGYDYGYGYDQNQSTGGGGGGGFNFSSVV